MTRLRRSVGVEMAVRGSTGVLGMATAVIGISTWAPLTYAAVVAAGATWLITFNHFTVAIQLAAPRWVEARVVAAYQAMGGLGIALGSWAWGLVAEASNLQTALLVSAGGLLLMPLTGRWLRMPTTEERNVAAADVLAAPEVSLPVTGRSGPILIEVEYRIDPANAAFTRLMQQVRHIRQRNGARDWKLSRDLDDPQAWVESYVCPTWFDYLRQRDRATQTERDLQAEVRTLQIDGEPIRIRRRLEHL